jgi:uncharacterized protein YhbP (UPF0306 family)
MPISSDPKIIERVVRIFKANRYLSLATTSVGSPWVAPLAYVLLPDFSMVFYSAKDSRHALNIEKHPQVAAAIFDSTKSSDDVDGIQLTGIVEEVGATELPKVMELYFALSFPDATIRARWIRPISDFVGNAPQRFYKLTPTQIFTIDLDSHKIDRRIEVDLEALRKTSLS